MGRFVEYDKVGQVALVRFNRPEVLNAYNSDLMADLVTAFTLAAQDENIKALVWEGNGRAWCAGADLKHLDGMKGKKGLQDFSRFVQLEEESTFAIRALGKPVIAAIQGYAIGGGCEYALLADIRIAAAGTRFSFPETSIGNVVTHGGTHILPSLVGTAKARELIFIGEFVDAVEAERIGLINRVVEPGELHGEAMKMAEKIAGHSAMAISRMKYALDNSAEWGYNASLKYESYANMVCSEQKILADDTTD